MPPVREHGYYFFFFLAAFLVATVRITSLLGGREGLHPLPARSRHGYFFFLAAFFFAAMLSHLLPLA